MSFRIHFSLFMYLYTLDENQKPNCVVFLLYIYTYYLSTFLYFMLFNYTLYQDILSYSLFIINIDCNIYTIYTTSSSTLYNIHVYIREQEIHMKKHFILDFITIFCHQFSLCGQKKFFFHCFQDWIYQVLCIVLLVLIITVISRAPFENFLL